MRSVFVCFSVFTFLGFATVCPAQILIDNFEVVSGIVQESTPPGSLTQNITIDSQTASRTLLADGPVALDSTGSLLTVAFLDQPGIAQVNYTSFEIDLSSLPIFSISMAQFSSPVDIGIIFNSAEGAGELATILSIPALANPQSFEVNLSTLSNFTPEFLTRVNGIEIGIQPPTPAELVGSIQQLAFVPEPSSAALLALGCGFFAFSRQVRRRVG